MTTTPRTAPVDWQPHVDGYLQRSQLGARVRRIVPLTGDASDRRYFRVLLDDGASIVLSLYAQPFEFERLTFVEVARLLAQMPVPIPAVLGHAEDLGVLGLQDLGDVTLQAHLGAASPSEHAALYREAVALIATLQRRGAELAPTGSGPYRIAFDVDKLMWELDFFLKHFVEAYRGLSIPGPDREALRDEFRGLAETLAAEPRVLCHRDYHSRNLMLHDRRLFIIDFQDARMGPDTYDLASLLRDSYVDLPEATVNELIAYFLALRGQAGSEATYRPRFALMALQRNLKALGTFGFQTTARRNPVYIQYIPRTLKYVRDNLARLPAFGRLHEILASQVDEFR